MGDFCILHLSDLHIASRNISSTHTRLLEDIRQQTKELKKIMVIVSGDIIDRGNYRNKEGALKFFEALYGILKDKSIIDINIVPGNHDKKRTENSLMCSQLSQISELELDMNNWEAQNESYADYLSLINSINNVYKKNEDTKTFGVDFYEINNKIVSIIRMDTTWSTNGGKEEKNKLVIGKYQRETLFQEYTVLKEVYALKNKHVDLTLAVAHHPLNWLKSSEEEWIKKYMIDDEYLNVDIYLCGHIHKMNIENWHNHEHSVMTLVTGIGWNHQNENEIEKDKKDNHRYSLYNFDIDKNACEIIVRKTQQNGKFDFDYSIYTNDNEKSRNKLCYPIKIADCVYPFIKIHAPEDKGVKNLYIDEEVLCNIQKVSADMLWFQNNCLRVLDQYKLQYLDRIEDFYIKDSENYKVAYQNLYDQFFGSRDKLSDEEDAIFKEAPEVTYELFTAFLQDISNYFVEVFKNDFEEGTNLRVHFQWYHEENDSFCQLCKSSSVVESAEAKLRELPWGGLIEEAYKAEKALIYSVNKKYNSLKPVRWDDYMTIVPKFLNYTYELRQNQSRIKRPILSIGISVSNNSSNKKMLSNILYIMGYLNVDTYIGEILDEFMRYFSVDYHKYLSYIRKLLMDE